MTASAIVERRSGLGGTDISAVVGMNPWRSAFDVWVEKTNQIPTDGDQETVRMTWGKRLQRVIAEAYTEETGRSHTWVDQTRRHRSREFHVWTPDAVCAAELRGIDCKTAGLDQADKWGESGSADVPDYVAIQCHWYMAGEEDFKAWDVALLLAGSDFRVYSIPRDPEIEGVLVEVGAKFWRDHVLGNNPPEIKATDAARRYLAKRFPISNGELRIPTEQEWELLTKYRRALELHTFAEAAKEHLETRVKLAIGDSDGFDLGGKSKVTYRRTKDRTETDWESVAIPLLTQLTTEQREMLVGLHTRTIKGHRRIYRKFAEEK